MSVQIAWVVLALVMAASLVALGVWITTHRRYLGILIDSRNKMSLSRFQLVAWTLLISSSIAAYVLSQRSTGFQLPTEVWALLGISLGSAAGAVIVKGNKNAQTATPEGTATPISIVHEHKSGIDASPKDMFKGEELADHEYVDIAKVQMFFFTLVALIGYAWAVWAWFGDLPALTQSMVEAEVSLQAYAGTDDSQRQVLAAAADAARQQVERFPDLSQQLMTILGISHTGYLTVKAAPKTPTP